MLRHRLAGAAAILVPVLILFWLDEYRHGGVPGVWLVPLGTLIALALALELCDLVRQSPYAPSPVMVAAGTVGIVLATAAPYLLGRGDDVAATPTGALAPWIWTVSAALAALVAAAALEMIRFRGPGVALARMSLTNFLIQYVGLSLSFLFALRLALPAHQGLFALFSVVLVTKSADTGAYFVGKTWGRHAMAPILSPKKTVEGAVGAVATAVVVAWLAHRWFGPWWFTSRGDAALPSALAVVGYGVSLALAGMVGDLIESLIKRDCQRKDSSSWLPGLGGLLDIFDSLLMAAPIGYLWWSSGWVH